jgi:hypothetical protein
VRDDALESVLCKRIEIGVPSSSFVADGINDRLGEIPVDLGSRSNGNFCESGFEDVSVGGRLQAQRKISVRTMAIRLAWADMNFFSIE